MSESYFRHFSRLAGALVVLLGGLVLLGWAEHWVFLVQILPGTAPMKCNTALGFIFGGASLVLLTTRRSHLAAWLGLFPAAIGVLTLMEYLTGENFSIDELFVRDYILTATAYPGRMSPLGAVCFSCLGLGLVVVGMKSRGRQWRLTVTGLLACVAAVIAFVALFGYVFGIQSAYGWGAYTRMAMPTAMAFLLLSLGLLVWAWRRAVAEQFNFLRWLPVTASLSLMAMIGFVSYSSLNQLKSSTDLSKHSSDVLDTSQSLLTDIFATQRGMRNYVLTGQDAALLIFQEGATNTPRLLARMIVQVADNPGQQQRVMSMASSLNGLLDYSRRLIDTRREQGINAGIQMESDGQGFMFIRHTLEELQAFTDEEHRLLDERTLAADADFHNTTFLMLMGSALAGVLLVIANFMASREIRIRQQIQETLRQSEEKFSKAFQSSPIAMSIVEADSGRYIEVNEGFCRLYGFTLSEVIGRTSLDLGIWKSPEERERQLMSRLRADGTVRNLELTRTIRTGETRVVLINSDRVDLDGKQCIVALLQDITERKRAEAALRESEERFRRSFEDAPIGLALVSLQGRWLRVNRALCDMIGRGEEELLATDFQAITHPDDLQTDLGLVQQLLDGKLRDYKMEKRYFHKQGQVVYVLLSVSLVRGPDGSPLYFVSQIQDITERKQAELKLLEQSEALRRSNQELEQFAYVASHDMQEPLRAVAGFTQILKANYQGKLDTRADSFITHIVDGAKRMADIIDDLLKLSRVGLQGKPYVKTGIEIPLALAMENLTVAIKEKQAVVSHGPLPALPIDASQLSLVFQNLIGNAMKFCRDRPPEIRVGAARLGDGTWEISVRDNGIGIEPKYFNRLFGIFQRLHTRDEYPGTGIGLAICKKVVERHGGKIWLDSLPGKGTTFYFTLPENQKLKS